MSWIIFIQNISMSIYQTCPQKNVLIIIKAETENLSKSSLLSVIQAKRKHGVFSYKY